MSMLCTRPALQEMSPFENGGVPWRVTSDKDFISMDKKTPEPLCQVLRNQAVNHGLASVEVDCHSVTPQVEPAAACLASCSARVGCCAKLKAPSVDSPQAFEAGGGESEPISFRFDVAPSASLKTHLFKPHPVESADKDNLRTGSIGAVFHNQYARIINNKRACVVWEA